MVLWMAKEIVGLKNNKRREWMTEKIWAKVEERKKVKEKINCSKTRRQKAELQADYRERDKEVRCSSRADKRKWVNELAEKAGNEKNMKEFFLKLILSSLIKMGKLIKIN